MGSAEPLAIKFAAEREVAFGSGNFFTDLVLPPNKPVVLLIISVHREDLLQLLDLQQDGQWIEDTIKGLSSFVLYERMTVEMERVLHQIGQMDEGARLSTLLYQTKAQELIYLLFARFLSRGDSRSINVNPEDVAKIYEVRAAITKDLSLSPSLPALATGAGMSLTKMKQLFQQIFGKSIYNYYQAVRMEQAAELLRHMSVSETGYRIGFVNMSHFSRLFEKHHLVKPKRYKDTMGSL
jgi:AraC-like DNA-binding protein